MPSHFVYDVLRHYIPGQCQAVYNGQHLTSFCTRRAIKGSLYCEEHAPSSAVDPDGPHRGEWCDVPQSPPEDGE